MKLKKLILKNFKAYKETEIDFDNISVIVGKNDAGKSTILHALDLFFNPKDAKKTDIFYKNNETVTSECLIECHFDIGSDEIKLGGEDKEVLITETNLLNQNGCFVIGCKYTEKSLSRSPFIVESYIKCSNYDISQLGWSSDKNCLEQMNKKELDEAIKTLKIPKPENADGRENHWKRKALEDCIVSQNIDKGCLEIVLGAKMDKEDRLIPVIAKLPKFKLFNNDKANSMGEKDNSAVIENEIKNIISEQMKPQLEEINKAMQGGMKDKINQLNDTYQHFFSFLGQDSFTLQDGIPKIDFKTNGIVDNKGLNIENRGSGFRRLALLSLHLSAHKEEEYKDMIFAIEEPETSQNPYNQKGIIGAIHRLIDKGSQVLITTHSPAMAKEFGDENIKYSVVENNGISSCVKKYPTNTDLFNDIINLLGILPLDTHGKCLIVFVEGIHDEAFLTKVGKDLFNTEDILFVPVGGKTSLNAYISANIFKSLKLPYGGFIDFVNTDQTHESMRQSLANLGYPDNIVQARCNDITDYLQGLINQKQDAKLNKKGIHKKIREMAQLDETHLNYIEEITEWFEAFKSWKIHK